MTECACGCKERLTGKQKKWKSNSHKNEFNTRARREAAARIQAILAEAVSPKTTPVPILEQEKKRDGMAAAANSNAEILSVFRSIARDVAYVKDTVTIDDVRAVADSSVFPPYSPGNWMGSVFLSSQWVCVGFKPATHAGSRGRIVRIWKLKG